MVSVGLLARMVAKAGKEEDVAAFLKDALPLAEREQATREWFAIRLGQREFGIFDAFPDDSGRKAHLSGPIAKALMDRAPELFDQPPRIESVEVLAAKVTPA